MLISLLRILILGDTWNCRKCSSSLVCGCGGWVRTNDRPVNSRVLYQLSYPTSGSQTPGAYCLRVARGCRDNLLN